MNDIKKLIEAVTHLNEAQKYDFLDTIVDRYAKEGMTLEDLRNMERAAREARPPEGLLSGLITPSYRVRYTLGHAAKKLNLPGLYNERGNFIFLDDRGEASGAASANRGEAEQLARVGLLPQDKAQRFNIQIDTPSNQTTRQNTTRGFRAPAAGANADGDEGEADAQAAATATRQAERDAVDAAAETPPASNNTAQATGPLERFASSGKGGLKNDPDEVDAIRELQRFLTNELELDTGGTQGRYGPKTRTAVRQFQRAITGVAVDGDAGPETIGKISEIRKDIARIRELIAALGESTIPVKFKSGLAQLLERELTQQERTELRQLVDKYKTFKQAFPGFETDLLGRAEEIAGRATAPNVPTNSPDQLTTPRTDGAPTVPGPNDQPARSNSPTQSAAPAVDSTPLAGYQGPVSAANLAADPAGDGNADDPEAQAFMQDTPTAAMQIWRAKGTLNDDERAVFNVMQNVVRNERNWAQLQQDFKNLPNNRRKIELVAYLQSFLNDGEMTRFVWRPLEANGIRPRPDPAVDAQTDDTARTTTGIDSSLVRNRLNQSVELDNVDYIKEMVRKICK